MNKDLELVFVCGKFNSKFVWKLITSTKGRQFVIYKFWDARCSFDL